MKKTQTESHLSTEGVKGRGKRDPHRLLYTGTGTDRLLKESPFCLRLPPRTINYSRTVMVPNGILPCVPGSSFTKSFDLVVVTVFFVGFRILNW